MNSHRGKSVDEVVTIALIKLGTAASALAKVPPEDASQVGGWFLEIARAVAAAAKDVNPAEQATIDKIAAIFGQES